jgi:hypothetical protein
MRRPHHRSRLVSGHRFRRAAVLALRRVRYLGLSSRCRRCTLYYRDCRELSRLNWLAVFVAQQFCAVPDRGGAPLAEDHVAVAFCRVHGMAAVLTHPSLELTGGVFNDGDSGCHEILQAHCGGRGSRREGYGGPMTDGGLVMGWEHGSWKDRVRTPSDYGVSRAGGILPSCVWLRRAGAA